MPDKEIKLVEIARDVRMGMDDAALMEKYGLSSIGLEALYAKLVNKGLLREDRRRLQAPGPRKINSKELLRDIQSGMGKADLIEKYGISSQTLQRVCKKLLDSRALPDRYSDWDFPLQSTTVVQENIRRLQRHFVDFDLPVYEESQPEVLGKVRDITEEGVGIRGIEAQVDESKRLVILGDIFGEIAPFELQARCRWIRRLEPDGELVSGFQFTKITDYALQELRKLIQLITLRAGH
ncbi:MAG: PilZ domain-containing protein [Deltaproteobacteria bacterium]|nr:PilZ domain-containing protein [Deltaproteobacteria bacterium]